ncbi:MAG: serine/threonine-protein kinase [Planctomycetota bacterium]
MSNEIILSNTDPDLPEEIRPGLTRYRNFRAMAKGGSGILQAALDPVTGRTIAIKTLLPQLRKNRNECRRFLREARVTAQLQHPNTVPVYDIGDDPEQGLFFVMKRISGENLFEVLKRIARKDGPSVDAYPLSKRIEIVADACQALAYAHARGVIHRDFKPENIWVGNFGEVILLDWGVAKVWGHPDDNRPIDRSHLGEAPALPDNSYAASIIEQAKAMAAFRQPATETKPEVDDDQEQAESESSGEDGSDTYGGDHLDLRTLTAAGQRPGTPLYMSPEQVDGSRGVDERSDVFSTGIVLYEAAAIREPFRGRTIDETFKKIRLENPQPPSVRAPEAGIPPALDRVVMRCLEKDRSRRYPSMRSLIADLRDLEAEL